MGKPLSEMTLQELWELFPIFLTEHRESWDLWYAQERQRLEALLRIEDVRMHHIGSTAIKGIWAKPIVDILVELPESDSMEAVRDILLQNGYRCMSEEPNRISLNRGYTEEGFAERVFHLHARFAGDNDELYFRDYMNEHPQLAKQYEALKLSLWKRYEHDRDGYTDAKGAFIREQTEKAKAEYGNRYAAGR